LSRPHFSCKFNERAAQFGGAARIFSILFFACFFAAALARQSFLNALSLAGLQVKRVTLYFLDNVLGLYLPLEPPKGVLEGFSLLKSNFCQQTTPPYSS
jgi:hypothetical protein